MDCLLQQRDDIVDDGVECSGLNCSCFSYDDIFVGGKDACGSDERIHGQGAAVEVVTGERYGERVSAAFAGDLAEEYIIAGEVGDNECRPSFRPGEVGEWERDNDNVAFYKSFHA